MKNNGLKIENNMDLVAALKKLNPGVNFEKVDEYFECISSTVLPNKLRLPEGFYYNDKNGITNKHNTGGQYLSLKVTRKLSEGVFLLVGMGMVVSTKIIVVVLNTVFDIDSAFSIILFVSVLAMMTLLVTHILKRLLQNK